MGNLTDAAPLPCFPLPLFSSLPSMGGGGGACRMEATGATRQWSWAAAAAAACDFDNCSFRARFSSMMRSEKPNHQKLAAKAREKLHGGSAK
jgi:hypothetical protein